MKFVANTKLGIGEIITNDGKAIEVYFEEVDQTKKMILDFVKTFETYEEAEASLNPEITEEVANKIIANIEADKKAMTDGYNAQARLEVLNAEASKRLMRNI